MSRCVPRRVETSAGETWSGRPCVRLTKCVHVIVAKLSELITHDASTVPMFSRASAPVPVVGDGIGGEPLARLETMRVAVAGVEEDGVRRRERQLAEALVV